MIPAGPKPILFFIPIFALLLGVMAILYVVLIGSQRSRFELTDGALRLRGDLWGRTIPFDRLLVERARIVNLQGEPPLQPVSRRMGTGMPGFASGWFRLRNGEKSLLYITDRSRVLYVPTSDGYSLLLSPTRPDAMLAELRQRAKA
jgi:hypothetical protein